MKTFTNYAEKKAKQFLNLLQGYTKGIRMTAILILLLMGFSNAWAADIAFSGGYIYFDNSIGINQTYIQLCARQGSWTGVSTMTNISNTKLYYVANPQGSGWGGILGWVVIGNSSQKTNSNFDNWSTYGWCSAWNTYGFNSGSTYLIVPTSTSKSQSVNTSYYSGGYSALNSEQTIKSAVNGADANSKATISITSYKMTGNGQVTEQTATLGTGAKDSYITAARTATTTLTVGDVEAGYQFDGWYTAATGGTQLETKKTYTYYPTAATTVYARFSEKKYTVTIKNDGHGTTNPTGAQSNVGQVTGLSIEATPAANYDFVNWTITSGSGSFGSTTSASTTFKPTSAATIQANFRSTATNSLTVAAGAGIASVAGSTDPITLGNKYDIKATPKTGYTFSTWTANPAANASFGSATTANTTVTVKNGSVTVTATATENMSTLTTSNKYDAGDPGYAVPNATVSKIGIATTATVTATAAGNGYTFTGWTLTNCTRTDGGADNATSITVRSNGDGKAATVVANYAEDLATTKWYISGNGNGSGNDLTPGSPFTGWATNGIQMFKKSGHSTEEIYYCTITANTVASSDDHFPFKVYNATTSKYWGNSGYWVTKENNHPTLSANSGDNMKFRPYLIGTYEFKLDATNASSPVLTVTWPVYNQLRISVANPADATNTGEFDMTGSGTYTVTRSLKANTTYTFKIVYDSEWYGASSGNLTRASSSKTLSTSSNNLTLKTDIAGNYTFTFNGSNKQLTVTYPTAYKITYGIGTNKGTTSVTTDPSVTSGDLVLAATPITFIKGTTADGYTWKNWNSQADGNGTNLGEGDTYVSSNRTGDITVYACYDLNTYTITYNTNGGNSIEQKTYNVTTATFNLPTPNKTGYTFAGWFDNEELTGDAVTQITKGTTGDKTFHAKWTANTSTITWNLNDGSETTTTSTYTYDGDPVHLPENPTRTGYTFNGWWTAETDGEKITNVGKDNKPTSDITYYAQWTEILSTITITTNPAEGGRIEVDGEPFTPGNTVQVGVDAHKKVTTIPNKGYGVNSWEFKGAAEWKGGQNTVTLASDGSGENGELIANYIPLSRNIQFDKQSGEGGTETATVTYTQNNYDPAPVDAPTRAGYTFGGYYSEEKGEGVQVVSAEGQWLANATDYTNEDGNWLKSAENTTLYAHWIGAPYTVELNQDGAAKKGSTTSVVANFEGNMPAITGDGALPTPPNGYAFMGYFDQKDGKGTQYYDSVGTSECVWDKAEDATLYAYFKAAEITIGLNAASFEPNSATPVIATATLKPEPVGTTSICWELLYNDDTSVAEHDPQPTGEPNKVQFNINDLATGTYQIKATLREGEGCKGTIISHATQVFTITSDHTITIKYVDENGQTIKASTTQSAHVSSLTEITAPEIIGYTFKEWEAGDGVSIKGATDGKKNTITIEYNAYYDGYLKAIYTKNSNIIYFYNTLGWENVYVYFYSGDYWNTNGTGTKSGGTYQGYLPMERMGESNIWYVNATGKATTYLVFGKDEQDNFDNFSDTEVIRRGDYNSSLPMFVPIADQTPTELNKYTDKEGKDCVTKYYNKGYWMNYPDNSGYTLDLFNHHSDNDPARSFVYPYSKNTIFPLQLEVEINAENVVEGNKKIWFRIQRNDKKNFGGDATTFPTVNPGTTGGFIADNDYKVELITPIAGTYTFTLDYTYNDKTKDYQYRIDVDYPASVGDYRILYSDEAVTNWSGNTKPDGWYHPSRVIKKGEDRKDIISFYINTDVQRRLSYQTIKSIDNTTGAITWNTEKVPFSYIDWSQIKESGVYNFTFVQDSKGISVENDIVPYEGNYYIRTDAMGGGWEDYKTNSENRMTYSSFSESDANSFGEQFSHYAVKWCEAGTNVKFTIANDYSHCISDTLAQDIIPLGNLTDEGTLLNNDIYDANIRFMWNRKTNKISRAYVGPTGDKQSQFLMLQSCSEFKDAAGNDLNPAEGDILDKEKNIYAARFTDTQNWIYERTIQVKPRTRVKLYASYPNGYHIYIENNTGWKDVALFAWKDGGDQPLGNWPGVQPTRTVEIEGKTYYDFPVNKYVFGSNLIFNNNVKENGQQTSDYTDFATVGEYYLTASGNKLTKNKYVQTTVEATAQYFRGAYAEGSCDNEHTVQILGGEGDTWNTIRVIYDFKTNRLMAAWMPNNNEIDTERSIESDVMIIRDHQNAAQCITFANDDSKLTNVKTVYGVMRFNRWILNNRGGEKDLDANSCGGADSYDEKTTNQNHPVLDPANQKSQYERALYFISFPFDVHLSDVFGFGTYGQHWIIEYYDGLKRAREGYWIDSDPNWKYVTDPANFVLEKYKGYILCLNLGKMAYDNTDFWAHNISQVELFFPSTTTMEEIAKAEVTMPKLGEEYLCKINRGDGTEGDRRVKDSYWRCIGVPSYANYSNVLKDEEGNPIQWQTSYKTFPFLYKWNKTDNTLTPQSTTNFKFETMHAYLVQNGGEIHWSAVNATPDKPNAGIIAKVKETTRNYEWRITLTQGEKEQDQAFVRLSDDEQVTTEFDFNQDLSKEFNYGRSDIYTLIGYEKAAANSLPLSEQTTLIPLGLSIEYNGDYTIAMPDGTANIGVTLIDTESNTRTNLSAGMEYTLTLKKGDYNNRFFIEISPIQQTPTDIEYVENSHDDQARKVLIDNILYIVRDGQIFDARGARVK